MTFNNLDLARYGPNVKLHANYLQGSERSAYRRRLAESLLFNLAAGRFKSRTSGDDSVEQTSTLYRPS
jgi:hypothetical protein